MAPTPCTDVPACRLGEGPWWDRETGTLYLVDIAGCAVHRHVPATGRTERLDTGAETGFVLLDTAGGLVAGVGDGIFLMRFGAPEKCLLARPVMHPRNRFNDAACDPYGRLWAGTMHADASRDRPPTGALYRIDAAGPVPFETGIGIANGLDWSPDGATLYFAETHLGTVWAYDYDVATGTPSAKRAFAQVPIEIGVPDGLTVDAAGRVHVAIWRGARLNVYAPDGRLDEVIAMPVPSPTSCCFGGDDLKTLFITTDGRRLSGECSGDPLPGHLFTLRREIPGLPASRMRAFDRPSHDIRRSAAADPRPRATRE